MFLYLYLIFPFCKMHSSDYFLRFKCEKCYKLFQNCYFDKYGTIRKPALLKTLNKLVMRLNCYKTYHQKFSDPLTHGTLIK